jgi:hypothetical protein
MPDSSNLDRRSDETTRVRVAQGRGGMANRPAAILDRVSAPLGVFRTGVVGVVLSTGWR